MIPVVSLVLLVAPVATAHAAVGTWSDAGSMTDQRGGAAAAKLADGSVLVAGGARATVLDTVERFDPAANQWSPLPKMRLPRSQAPAVTLPDGRVLVPGGRHTNYDATDSAEVYDPKTGRWDDAGTLVEARGYHDAVLLANGQPLVIGGDGLYDRATGAERWNPATNQWKATGPVVTTRFQPAVTRLADGRVFVAGGWNGDELDSAEIYDPIADAWTATAPMGERRGHAEAALLPDGRVLVAGGYGFENRHPTASRTAEIYDPRSNTWTRTADLATPRGEGSAMVTLADGRPAITGGFWWSVVNPGVNGGLPTWSGDRYEDTLEIFDPARGTWALSSTMKRGRAGHVALALNDGSLLVAGGFFAGTVAERFTPPAVPTPTPDPPADPAPTATATPTPSPSPAAVPGRVAFRSNLKRMTLSRSGALAVKVRCDDTGDCKDSLVLRRGKVVLARAQVSLPRNAVATVKLKLSKSARGKLSRRGTKLTLELPRQRVSLALTVKRA
ncbi:Kelch repeat-containing protein [Solirubrobacter deserti]|uniref:Kelch repeat-containing protein n=1 Tax=Solirubrobacter deserti TaxID=2282478 RepID=UPI0022CD40BB|nr:kelch repeat-containing protein [Solirubrobacter deserti]